MNAIFNGLGSGFFPIELYTGLAILSHSAKGRMSDNLKEPAMQDASRVSLSEDWEVNYSGWALGVTRERLEHS